MTSVKLLVELASLQTAFLTLDEAIKTTNRRVNALDNVVRPKLENTIAYIKASHTVLRESCKDITQLKRLLNFQATQVDVALGIQEQSKGFLNGHGCRLSWTCFS